MIQLARMGEASDPASYRAFPSMLKGFCFVRCSLMLQQLRGILMGYALPVSPWRMHLAAKKCFVV